MIAPAEETAYGHRLPKSKLKQIVVVMSILAPFVSLLKYFDFHLVEHKFIGSSMF